MKFSGSAYGNESDWPCQDLGVDTTAILQADQTLLQGCEGLAREINTLTLVYANARVLNRESRARVHGGAARDSGSYTAATFS